MDQKSGTDQSSTKHMFSQFAPTFLRKIILRLVGPSLKIVAIQLARAAIAHRSFLSIVEDVADVYLQQRYNNILRDNECARSDWLEALKHLEVLYKDSHKHLGISKLQKLWCLAPAFPLRFVLLPGFIIRDVGRTRFLSTLDLSTKISDGHIRGMWDSPITLHLSGMSTNLAVDYGRQLVGQSLAISGRHPGCCVRDGNEDVGVCLICYRWRKLDPRQHLNWTPTEADRWRLPLPRWLAQNAELLKHPPPNGFVLERDPREPYNPHLQVIRPTEQRQDGVTTEDDYFRTMFAEKATDVRCACREILDQLQHTTQADAGEEESEEALVGVELCADEGW